MPQWSGAPAFNSENSASSSLQNGDKNSLLLEDIVLKGGCMQFEIQLGEAGPGMRRAPDEVLGKIGQDCDSALNIDLAGVNR